MVNRDVLRTSCTGPPSLSSFALPLVEHPSKASAFASRERTANRGGERFERLGVTRFRIVGANPGANGGERCYKSCEVNRL